MKKLLLIGLFSSSAFAGEAYWCPEKPNELRFPRPNAGCTKVDSDTFDSEVVDNVGGLPVVSQAKKAAKEAAKEAAIAAEANGRGLKAQRIAACASVLDGVDSANTVTSLRSVVKCLMEYVR